MDHLKSYREGEGGWVKNKNKIHAQGVAQKKIHVLDLTFFLGEKIHVRDFTRNQSCMENLNKKNHAT